MGILQKHHLILLDKNACLKIVSDRHFFYLLTANRQQSYHLPRYSITPQVKEIIPILLEQ